MESIGDMYFKVIAAKKMWMSSASTMQFYYHYRTVSSLNLFNV